MSKMAKDLEQCKRDANRESKRAYARRYDAENREAISARKAAYRAANNEAAKARDAAYYAANREKVKSRQAAYRAANRETINARKLAHRAANKEAINARAKAKRKQADADPVCLEKRKSSRRAWRAKKHRTNPLYSIGHRLRCRVRDAVRSQGTWKKSTTVSLIGCSIAELKRHIESMFKPGMSWHNRSEWHIDHIIPCSAFDLTDESQQRACFHFSNLQPLWAAENLSKSNRLPSGERAKDRPSQPRR